MRKKTPQLRIAVLTGAGISAESGLRTFRDSDGLWEGFRVEDVATPEAWFENPERVLRFYDERRRQVIQAQPNAAHHALVELEDRYQVDIITQNIDDLHERAGSSRVLHLHGEVRKARSSIDSNLIYPIEGDELQWGSTCELGSQLRPFVVWFGESVPMMEPAARIVEQVDIFIVIGTSLAVYPAASLIHFVSDRVRSIVIDRKIPTGGIPNTCEFLEGAATVSVPTLVRQLLQD